MLPKVSVILCCYNQKLYVRSAIESVLNQTYPNTELIAIDNGSTDGSRDILLEYKNHPQIKILANSSNAAVTQRLNEGIAASSGDFISILYADDYYLPNKTERQMECFSSLSAKYGVVHGPGYRYNVLTKTQFVEKTSKRSGFVLREFFEHYHEEGFINPVSPLVRRECFLRYPFLEGTFVEGEGIYFRIAMSYAFQYLDEPLVVMRDHLENIGKAIRVTKQQEDFIIKNLLNSPEFPKELTPVVRAYIARVLRNYGWQSVRLARNGKWARQCFVQMLRWNWRQGFHPRVIVGLGLSFIPLRLLDGLNRLANGFNREKRVMAFRDAYQ